MSEHRDGDAGGLSSSGRCLGLGGKWRQDSLGRDGRSDKQGDQKFVLAGGDDRGSQCEEDKGTLIATS